MNTPAWQRLLLIVAVIAVANPLLVLKAIDLDRSGRTRISAESQLQNCLSVEAVKAQLVGAVNDSIKGHHLTPKQQAKTDEFLARFAPNDCYALPIVKAAGIKAPPPKHRPKPR